MRRSTAVSPSKQDSHPPRWISLAALAMLALSGPFALAAEHDDENAIQLATGRCARCHGAQGVSPFVNVPTLAAQRASYLKAEILDLATHERDDALAREFMQVQAGDIDKATASSLAHFYAQQPPPPAVPGDPDKMEKGRALFEKGNQNQVACAVCHGQHAEGGGIFPRLAGQHAVYLQHQLEEKQRRARRTSIMHGMIDSLSVDDMKNLAAYLASLP